MTDMHLKLITVSSLIFFAIINYTSFCLTSPILCAVLSCPIMSHSLQPSRLLCPWGFSRRDYCWGLLCPPPGDLPNPGIKLRCPMLWVDSLPSEPPGKPKILEWEACPSPGDLPGPGMELGSPALQVDSPPVELPRKPYKTHIQGYYSL